MSLRIKHIIQKKANAFVIKEHRHHDKVQGSYFQLALYDDDKLVGVAIVGRPNGQKSDDGETVEVLRNCVKEGVKNGCSKLNAACARVAKEMGFKKIITYTLMKEPGTSLIASGWELEAINVGSTKKWKHSDRKNRSTQATLFAISKKYPDELKKRWGKRLRPESLLNNEQNVQASVATEADSSNADDPIKI